MKYLVIAAVLVALPVSGCALGSASPPDPGTSSIPATTLVPATPTSLTGAGYETIDGWPTSTPEQQGMSSATLAKLFDEIVDRGHHIDAVVVIRGGHLVVDAAVPGYQDGSTHIVHSVTKSIVSTLVGIAIHEGYLEGVEQRVLDVFSGRSVANLDDRKRRMTIEHLLTMTTGFECRDSYLYSWRGLREMRSSSDWVQHVLDLPMETDPGAQFEYCNGASFLLSAILQQTTGMTAERYAETRLFDPIGIGVHEWPSNPDGISIGWGELRLAPRDLARFGWLILSDGRWAGAPVVPEAWVSAATSARVDATLQDRYGYQWWIRKDGVVEALGYAGQYVIVDRKRDLVAVFLSDLADRDFFVPDGLYDRYVVGAVESDTALPPNPPAEDALDSSIGRFADA